MNILITGASGFIGRALTSHLINKNHKLRLLLRNKEIVYDDQVEQYLIDEKSKFPKELFYGIDVIIHLAGIAHQRESNSKIDKDQYKNFHNSYTKKLIKGASESEVSRFIFLSSIGVNGNQSFKPFTEIDKPNPSNDYAVAKYLSEKLLIRYCKDSKMNFVIIRPPIVFGINVPGNFSRILRWANSAYNIPLPFGSINNKRSIISISNLIDFITLCIFESRAKNEIFLVSDSLGISTTDLLRRVSIAFGRRPILFNIPESFLYKLLTFFGYKEDANRLLGSLQIDISKASKLLNWKPKYSLDYELKNISTSYKKL